MFDALDQRFADDVRFFGLQALLVCFAVILLQWRTIVELRAVPAKRMQR